VITPFDLDATSEFWWEFPSLMTDQGAITAVSPFACSDSSCLSYFIPGPVVGLNISVPKDSFPDLTAWMVNAPGYQIDYSPVTNSSGTFNLTANCKLYGMNWAAIFICIKSSGFSFLGGTIPLHVGLKFEA
jgi:hypothetical protein